MGRVKGRHLKVAAKYLIKKFASRFSSDMVKNKAVLKEMDVLPGSKKERNKLAGELTVYFKRQMPKVENEAAA